MQSKIKVLMVNKAYPPWVGGVEEHLRTLCLELRDKVDLSVLVANTKMKTETDTSDGFPVIKIASTGRFLSTPIALGFSSWFSRIASDIIHFHLPYPVATLSYISQLKKQKKDRTIVVTYHCDILRSRWIYLIIRPYLDKLLKLSDRIVVSSPNLLENSARLETFRTKCEVIPFGIDTKKFSPEASQKAEVERIRATYGTPLILFMGRLVAYKGAEYLINAMKEVRANLLFVGGGPLRERLVSMADRCGLLSRVFFVPRIPEEDRVNYLNACDFLVLPSVDCREAFGIVQLEAQACAKPVISTNLPTGVPYANKNGLTGIVVSPRSSSELAAAMNRLVKDNSLRIAYGKAGCERVKNVFRKEIMAEQTLSLYRRLLE